MSRLVVTISDVREWANPGGVYVYWWFIQKGTAMEVKIIVETTFENGTTKRHQLGRLSRPFRRTPGVS